ncbi:GntR family transcriptional regulator [Streptomyces johnsoniae]|uniref:GntR family transcriptional regulator n=1 Tax=Streptomyces johnsoniae TaxID=3075532 RepID=A0ABU2SBS8_9ACTN|nr:GntR family transcriptional regulator [Streptomyces sp. DSM 41886]MDT0446427.1 GntR family transcriptional regulator [Streptomyces sp. DSM 41886]
MSRPDQQQPEPKYWHLKTVLSQALDTEFSVGQTLPNERELAARFGVARATLRQALDQLELEGRLQRRRGVGTTVAPPRFGVDVSPGQHTWPGTAGDPWVATDCTVAVPPRAVADALGMAADRPVETVRRTLFTHGQPIGTEHLFIPPGVLPAGEWADTARGADRAGAVLARLQLLPWGGRDRAVELGSAGADAARLLDRLPGSPVLIVTTGYASGGRPVAVGVATYRADTCRLTFGDQEPLSLTAG